MRLSELKQLNPKAYEVFLEEMKKQNKKKDCDKMITEDCFLSCCVYFSDTKQRFNLWADIAYNKDFTLFNEWLNNQK